MSERKCIGVKAPKRLPEIISTILRNTWNYILTKFNLKFLFCQQNDIIPYHASRLLKSSCLSSSACQLRGRSYTMIIPLSHNNFDTFLRKEKRVRVPPPPPPMLSDLFSGLVWHCWISPVDPILNTKHPGAAPPPPPPPVSGQLHNHKSLVVQTRLSRAIATCRFQHHFHAWFMESTLERDWFPSWMKYDIKGLVGLWLPVMPSFRDYLPESRWYLGQELGKMGQGS